MAIAYVATGAVVRGDVGTTGTPIAVPTPVGFASGNLLIIAAVTDDNTGLTTPAGWNRLGLIFETPAGNTSTASPYLPRPRMVVFYKIASGSEGPSVNVTVSTASWPAGNPYFIAGMIAYSGTDQSSYPFEAGGQQNWWSSNNAAMMHNAVTTSIANDWLLTMRFGSASGSALSCSISGGTNVERMDSSDGNLELGLAFYDSNGALAAGTQTQRVTTFSPAPDFGSIGLCLAIKPPVGTSAAVIPGTGNAFGTAYSASAVTVDGSWNTCAVPPVYAFGIDWDDDGDFTDLGEDVTSDILSGGVSLSYGRDQSRQLSPPKQGSGSFILDNSTRIYSPENSSGPLFGDLDASRDMQGSLTLLGTTYGFGRMRVDDYNVVADFGERSASFTFADGLKTLDGIKVATPVRSSQRTGDLLNYILDLAGWAAGRDIDPGATVVPWWWLDGGTSLFQAVIDLVKSEGLPSIAYVGLDGTFVFRDRHHRILRANSLNVQATFNQNTLDPCITPATSGLVFTAPFSYAHGARDIINSVAFDAVVREPSAELSPVWTAGSSFRLTIGQSTTLTASGSDPFTGAVVPIAGIDYTTTGAGVLSVSLSRDNGSSVDITVTAVGGTVTVNNFQLRAFAIPVVNTVHVQRTDTTSIASHGRKDYPDTAPWASPEDSYAIAGLILLYYAKRRPTVQLRVTAKDPRHLWEMMNLRISDRVHLTYGEMGLDDDFFIESVSHQVDRMNNVNGQPPVHSAVFGIEKGLGTLNNNPFRFDVRGAGFDQGVFDPLAGDNPSAVFVFDAPQGAFDVGVFGT